MTGFQSALGTGLRLETILAEPFSVVVPREHRLAGREAVDVADLADEPMVLFSYQQMPGFAGQVLQLFDKAGRTPRVTQQANDHETALGLVAAGVGVTILTASETRLSTPDVGFVPLRDSPQSKLAIARHPSSHAPTADAFAAQLHQAARAFGSGHE